MSKRRLNDAVHQLVNHHKITITIDGTRKIVTEEPLLDMLLGTWRDSRSASGGGGSGVSIPIAPTFIDLADDIKAEARGMLRKQGIQVAGTVHQVVQAWADATNDENAHHAAENWVFQIRQMFEPVKVHHIAAPCPACGQKKLQAYALGDGSYAECDCGARWEANQLHDLAAMIQEAA